MVKKFLSRSRKPSSLTLRPTYLSSFWNDLVEALYRWLPQKRTPRLTLVLSRALRF